VNKKDFSERDICSKFITPAILSSGWDNKKQIREEFSITAGRIVVRGEACSRGKRKRADYVLFHKANIPLAVIEAKDNKHPVGAGMQQALEYARMMNVSFVYSSNGDGFVEHDVFTGIECELTLDEFPTPEKLWDRYKKGKNINIEQEKLVVEPYYYRVGDKTPRYYQMNAINLVVEGVSKGLNRLLLVMATGTGKTYVAFQIIHRLWSAKKVKKVLYLADRNILIDQTIVQDFEPFKKVMTKIKSKTFDSSYEIYMGLYQAMTGPEESDKAFKQLSPNFFDLIIVDECHRGSAKEDSAWREILEYYSSAVQIGLTATPKETKAISNIDYFGEPIYTYTLKQGIQDGFLAPYKVHRYLFDKDLDGFIPCENQLDKYGQKIEVREYGLTDFDKTLVLEKRTNLVAKAISDHLKKHDRYMKTIVFCVDIDHADRMRRALINENNDLVALDSRYVMKITGDDDEGKAQLDNFIDPESSYPVIATTSKLLTTGVDAKTCKVIAIDSNIESMIEFKQTLGRGTRINEKHNKLFFTLLDFRNVSRKFSDPEFDGVPIQDDDFEGGGSDTGGGNGEGGGEGEGGKKYYVNNVEVKLLNERVQYYDKDGKLITEDIYDYTRKNVRDEFSSISDFLKKWTSADRTEVIIEELAEKGILIEALRQETGSFDVDDFELICHIAFDMKPKTRSERAKNVKKRNYFEKYSGLAKQVLIALLEKYKNEGIDELNNEKLLSLPPFITLARPSEIIKSFGGKAEYKKAIIELEHVLFDIA